MDNGADPNFTWDGYFSPLEAVFVSKDVEKRTELMKLLVERGADVNRACSGDSIIFQIVGTIRFSEEYYLNLRIEQICYLLDNGANRKDEYESSVSYFAVSAKNNILAVKLIDEYNFDVNEVGYNKMTPLIRAVAFRSEHSSDEEFLDIIESLLERGADKTSKDNTGKTAYDYAVEEGYNDIAKLLKP